MRRRDFLGTAAFGASAMLMAKRLPAAELSKFKLGVINDEISPDLEHDLQWCQHYGLQWVELRGVWGKNVTEMEPDNVKRAQDLLAKYNIRVSVIDSPYYKITLPGTEVFRREGSKDSATMDDQKPLLERAMARAKDFGTDKVRIFAFWRVKEPKTVFDRIAKLLDETAAIAKKENIRLVLENEYACNVATGAESVEMLNAVKAPALGLNWDSGNAFAAGELKPYPDGYAGLDKKRIWHMHLKDAVMDDQGKSHWKPIGDGSIDFVGQFKALLKESYQGTLSLETHYSNAAHNKEESSNESMKGLLEAIKKA
jgi:L-ribulose-5-phosphate 3-epimerase